MHGTSSFDSTTGAPLGHFRSWAWALVVGGALAACGSSKTSNSSDAGTNPNQGTGTGGGGSASTANPNTSTTINPNGTGLCTPSNSSQLSVTSPAVVFTPASGTAISLQNMQYIYNPAVSNSSEVFAITARDFDYCTFAADHGYTNNPIGPYNSASFYLVNTNPNTPLVAGQYMVGQSSGLYIYGTTSAGSVLESSTGSTGGAKCTASYLYPISGSITLTTAPPTSTNSATLAGVAGTFDNIVMSSDGVTAAGTISGAFSSGSCSGTITGTANATPDLCACIP